MPQTPQTVPPPDAPATRRLIEDFIAQVADLLAVDTVLVTRAAVRVGVIVLLAWGAIRIIHVLARRIEAAVDDGDDTVTTLREKRGRTLSQLLRSVGRVVVFVIAGLLSLNVFIDIGPILAGAGILGLAVSFGAQSLVKDVITGFFMLLENQLAVGDVVEIAGKSGAVEKLTMRVVVLRDFEGTLHVIPNSEIRVVSNRTRDWARAVVDVGVAYGTPLDRALAVVSDEAASFSKDPEWASRLDGPAEVFGVQALQDSAVVLRVGIRTRPGAQWEAGREFRRRIKERLDREAIEIPFPQRRVHVEVSGPTADAGVISAAAGGG